MAEDTCFIFRPSEEEFRDFRAYIEDIERLHPGIGICKIIPPSSWFVREYDLSQINFTVQTPVRQLVSGKGGAYHVDLVERGSMSLQQFRAQANLNSYENDDYEERERRFWKQLRGNSGYGEALYGADVPGTLFSSKTLSHLGWNLNNLDNMLRALKQPIPGVNTTMMYFGSWRALFAFHVEDLDLFSINYLHYGEPKSWYSIKPGERKHFEAMASACFQSDHYECREFLRHKTKIFSPARLKESAIKPVTVLQKVGEFVITFPGAYHAGFNHGFNIAEATNFALPSWLDLGRKAGVCRCSSFSVHIDVEQLETYHLRAKVKQRRSGPSSSSSNRVEPIGDQNDYFDEHENRVRCVCSKGEKYCLAANGQKRACIDRLGAIDNHEEVELVCCSACELWFHPDCVKTYYEAMDETCDMYHLLFPSSSSKTSEFCATIDRDHLVDFLRIPLCHVCHFIECNEKSINRRPRNLDAQNNAIAKRKRGRPPNPKTVSVHTSKSQADDGKRHMTYLPQHRLLGNVTPIQSSPSITNVGAVLQNISSPYSTTNKVQSTSAATSYLQNVTSSIDNITVAVRPQATPNTSSSASATKLPTKISGEKSSAHNVSQTMATIMSEQRQLYLQRMNQLYAPSLLSPSLMQQQHVIAEINLKRLQEKALLSPHLQNHEPPKTVIMTSSAVAVKPETTDKKSLEVEVIDLMTGSDREGDEDRGSTIRSQIMNRSVEVLSVDEDEDFMDELEGVSFHESHRDSDGAIDEESDYNEEENEEEDEEDDEDEDSDCSYDEVRKKRSSRSTSSQQSRRNSTRILSQQHRRQRSERLQAAVELLLQNLNSKYEARRRHELIALLHEEEGDIRGNGHESRTGSRTSSRGWTQSSNSSASTSHMLAFSPSPQQHRTRRPDRLTSLRRPTRKGRNRRSIRCHSGSSTSSSESESESESSYDEKYRKKRPRRSAVARAKSERPRVTASAVDHSQEWDSDDLYFDEKDMEDEEEESDEDEDGKDDDECNEIEKDRRPGVMPENKDPKGGAETVTLFEFTEFVGAEDTEFDDQTPMLHGLQDINDGVDSANMRRTFMTSEPVSIVSEDSTRDQADGEVGKTMHSGSVDDSGDELSEIIFEAKPRRPTSSSVVPVSDTHEPLKLQEQQPISPWSWPATSPAH